MFCPNICRSISIPDFRSSHDYAEAIAIFFSPSALSCAVLAVTDAVIRKADRASWIIGRISMPEDHSAGRKDEDDRADLDENGGLLLGIDWRRCHDRITAT